MTDRDAALDADGDRDIGRGSDGVHSRRCLLAGAGGALSLVLASAGCLSNPWGPDRPDAGTSTDTATSPAIDGSTDGDDAAATTADDGTGGETTTDTDDGATTSDGDRTTTDGGSAETATETTPPEEREPDQVVEVAPDGFRFEPETFAIDAGDTVHWQWTDTGHNVRVREKPEGSDWTGTPGSASDTYAEGYLLAHTFEAAGDYECYCAPHQSLGMEGSFTVR
ncbi:halocyanin [Halorubellus sp. JP-L1]|uniref:plastocyanin/azurin family copper-binding protein n=1 Tax=Halorubellus sp. JP-L1 TaxID=2715753 RepID=UPI00140CEFE6|nr:plastocyanin/azurin family copper-binding protein [Halorubellus sp. JP-L1]NHN41456.1 halocyanin [Halorubellus sp. JP-L1]